MGLMALANINHAARTRHIHLFDSFQRICLPDESIDSEADVAKITKELGLIRVSGKLKPMTGIYASIGGLGILEGNLKLLEHTLDYGAEYIHYHVGCFQDTLPDESPDMYSTAILRLDGNWYS